MKKELVLGGLVVLAFAVGRMSAPEKTRTVEVVKEIQVEQKSQEQNRQVIVTERREPDGTVVRRKRIIEIRKEEATKIQETEQVREVVHEASAARALSFGLLAGKPALWSAPRFGGYVHTPLMGPVDLGIWGTTEPCLGISLGLTF